MSASSSRSGPRTWLPAFVGLVVSAALLALAVRNVRVSEAVRTVGRVRAGWLPCLAAGVLADILVRALRWRILLSAAAPRAGIRRLYELETIGLAVNNVTFLRLGEVARAVLASRELGAPVLAMFATIFVERMLDLMSLTALFAATAGFYPVLIEPRLRLAAAGIAAAAAATLVALAHADGFIHGPEWERRLGRLPKAYRWLRQAALGTRGLRSASAAAAVVALGFGLWTLDAGLFWASGRALDLAPRLSYGDSVLVLAGAAASSFLPAVPGSFGAYEQAVKILLMKLGVEASAAFGFAALVHLFGYLLVTFLGMIFLYQAGHTLAALKAMGRDAATGTGA